MVGVPRANETALVAYVVSDPDGPARSATELVALVRPHLQAALPQPMVPTLVTLPALPLTRDGEVDRAALPVPEWTLTMVAPRNPVEVTMAGIWADLLGTSEPIGVRDNLFALGAGSLAAVRFAGKIADIYGVSVAIHHIVATPTIAALAEIVSADLDSADIAQTADEGRPGGIVRPRARRPVARALRRPRPPPSGPQRRAVSREHKEHLELLP